jgi:hypothetical protein
MSANDPLVMSAGDKIISSTGKFFYGYIKNPILHADDNFGTPFISVLEQYDIY